jgi:hypothetical protein
MEGGANVNNQNAAFGAGGVVLEKALVGQFFFFFFFFFALCFLLELAVCAFVFSCNVLL